MARECVDMRINGSFTSIEQVTDQLLNGKSNDIQKSSQNVSFAEVFESKLKFSKHAGERLADRHLSLTDEQMDRLLEGTKKADAKGINESLVLMDDMAFIVIVKNRTVITAMDQSESKDNIYTNIDGAVII